MEDFRYEVLADYVHRPWPVPDSPWVMRQTWTDLLFAHWRVPAQHLRARIPRGLTLDLHDGDAWIGVVPFRMSNVALRGLPAVPYLSAFPELNVRTYVTRVGALGPGLFSDGTVLPLQRVGVTPQAPGDSASPMGTAPGLCRMAPALCRTAGRDHVGARIVSC